MLFRRKMYQRLLGWKQKDADEKALLIEGARRIGKTTVAEEFAKNEYESYMLIDFSKASPAVFTAFENYAGDLDTLFFISTVPPHPSRPTSRPSGSS